MVVCVGCDFNRKELSIYDSETKEVISLDFDTEECKDKNDEINLLCKCLKTQLNDKPIESLAVSIDEKCDNTFRKKFVQEAVTQNVKVVRFLEWKHLLLCFSIERLSITPNPYDILFIFLFFKEEILLMKANFDENNGWEFYGSSDQKRSGNDIEDFIKLRETLPNIYGNPYICVFSKKEEIDEIKFKKVFSSNKKMEFELNYNPTMTALYYARYISKEDGFIGYKINMTLSREIILRHTSQIQDLDKTYCKIPAGIKLPFTLTFQEEDTGWFIKAYENGYDFSMDKFSVKTPGKNNIIFTIDVNGIYSVETKKVFEWKNLSIAESITIPPKSSKYRTDISTVGIDLGTSKFCSSFIEKNGPILAPLLNLDAFVWNEKPSNVSTTFLPSRVMFDENGEGEIAFGKNCGNIFFDWKMIIGKKYDEIHIDSLWPFNISNFNNTVNLELPTLSKSILKTPQEISSAILKQIKQNFDNHHSAVITIPSNFDESKIKIIAEAANIANWDVIHFITEPIAAAFAYFSMKKVSNNSNIIIINFGGGFLDICIANVCKNQMKILSIDGDESIGAREFDKVLYNYFMNILKAKFNIENINKQILIQKCTDIKHTFSKETNAWLDVSDLDINSTKKIKITKEEFETLSKNSLSKVKNAILSVTKNSKLQINQLNYVFHVGGGCYMPMIKELLLDIFPNASHQCTDKPDEIVAKGAALYAYYLETRNDLPTWKRWALNTILYLDGREPEYW